MSYAEITEADLPYPGIAAHEILSADAERELAERCAAGDADARAELVRCNQRLIGKIARRYMYRGLPLLDLIQEGNIGLLRAIDKYEPGRGLKLSTYAVWWIRQAMERAIDNQAGHIRLPVHMAERVAVLNRAEQDLALAGIVVDDQALAAYLDWPIARVAQARAARGIRRAESLDQSLADRSGRYDDGESRSLASIIPDAGADVPEAVEARADQQAMLAIIANVLAELDGRARQIIVLRYRLDEPGSTQPPRTLEEIGQMLSLTRERVRQIEHMAKAQIRNHINVARQIAA